MNIHSNFGPIPTRVCVCAWLRAHNLTLSVFSIVSTSFRAARCYLLFIQHTVLMYFWSFWNGSGSGQTDIDTDLVSSFMLAFFVVVVVAFQLWGCQLMMAWCGGGYADWNATHGSLWLWYHIHVCAAEAPTRRNVFNFSLMNSPQIFRAYFNAKGWQIPWRSWYCYELLRNILKNYHKYLSSSKWSIHWVTVFYLRLTPPT